MINEICEEEKLIKEIRSDGKKIPFKIFLFIRILAKRRDLWWAKEPEVMLPSS